MTPRTTRPPPPPDPIDALDALDAERARAREAASRLRDADDFNEPTGRFDVQPVIHVHPPQVTIPDAEPTHRNGPAAIVIALGSLAAAGLAIAHGLGLL